MITERYAYSAYGTPTILNGSLSPLATSAEDNRYTYTGREFDETLSLYHYRARMYDSMAGRFCSRDPIRFRGSKWNLYQYVSNKTLSWIDPFGREERATDLGVKPQLTGCVRKFYHLIAFPEVPEPDLPGSPDLAEKLRLFSKCVSEKMSNPFVTQKRAIDKCIKELEFDPLELENPGKELIASIGCCELQSGKANQGDPCNEGTHPGDPPGTKPRCETWDHNDPKAPRPDYCGDCCDFRWCKSQFEQIIEFELPKTGTGVVLTYMKTKFEHETCLGNCAKAGASSP